MSPNVARRCRFCRLSPATWVSFQTPALFQADLPCVKNVLPIGRRQMFRFQTLQTCLTSDGAKVGGGLPQLPPRMVPSVYLVYNACLCKGCLTQWWSPGMVYIALHEWWSPRMVQLCKGSCLQCLLLVCPYVTMPAGALPCRRRCGNGAASLLHSRFQE